MKNLKYLIPPWMILGAYRGNALYKYETKYNLSRINYHSQIFKCFLGITIYANPIFVPFVLRKELYRFYVIASGLHEEKMKYQYYLWF